MSDTEWISVEEAARRAGISVASVRRRCAAGDYACRKVGRSWLIDAASVLPQKQRPAVGTGASSVVDLVAALGNVLDRDLKEGPWAPDILTFQDELQDRDELFQLTADKLDLVADFDPPTIVPVPKSPLFVRQGTDLRLTDRLAYQAIAQEIEKSTDPKLSDRSYASRTKDKQRKYRASRTQPWLNWRRDTRRAVVDCRGWMIKTDITAYFDFIEHRQLMILLQEAGVPEVLLKPLRQMLRIWAPAQGRGLPQGPDASRILANFYLVEVDAVLTSLPNVEYFRFMDDIRIVSSSRADATAALQQLGDLSYKIGLPLSTQKTQALGFEEALEDEVDNELDGIAYTLSVEAFDEDSQGTIRQRLADLFEEAMPSEKSSGRIEKRRAKFSLWRLFVRREKRVLLKVLANLESLGPLERLVPYYLSHWIAEPDVSKEVANYLQDSERNISDYTASWLLATVLHNPAFIDPGIFDYARDLARNRNTEPYLRVVAMNVVVISGRSSDIDAIERMIFSEYDPVIVRGGLVALHRAKKLTKAARERVRKRQGYSSVLDYLEGRDALPSIVFGKSQMIPR